jgi:hypothetical protein
MADDFRHPVWGQDTRTWRWWQHVLCWALYLPAMAGVALVGKQIVRWLFY